MKYGAFYRCHLFEYSRVIYLPCQAWYYTNSTQMHGLGDVGELLLLYALVFGFKMAGNKARKVRLTDSRHATKPQTQITVSDTGQNCPHAAR